MTGPNNKALIAELRFTANIIEGQIGEKDELGEIALMRQAADALEAAAAREAGLQELHRIASENALFLANQNIKNRERATEARIARLEAVAEAARLVNMLAVLPWIASNIDNDEADRRQAALREALASLDAK